MCLVNSAVTNCWYQKIFLKLSTLFGPTSKKTCCVEEKVPKQEKVVGAKEDRVPEQEKVEEAYAFTSKLLSGNTPRHS